jgi:hypothetical protein
MRIDISKITSAVNKISDFTSGDKTIPGVLLNLLKVEGSETDGRLQVCYSDGHKSLIEEIDASIEEGDHIGGIVVSYEQLNRAVGNCQPSGSIKVKDINFTFLANNIVRIWADQLKQFEDAEGNVEAERKLATKKMDLLWTEPGSDMKSSILTRMKYNDIFDSDVTDEYDKSELVDALSKTSTEKGRLIYLSANVQTIFVANQAHVTAVPISKLKTLNMEEQDTIRATLVEQNAFTEEALKQEIEKEEKRIHQSLIVTQQIAKALIGIFNKTSADKVYMYRQDKYCNIYIDTDTEKVGIWFEMATASKAHTGMLDRYNSLKYENYQLLFFREFLDNIVKSALDATKSEKIQFKFEPTQFDDASSALDLVIASGSSSASVSDTYRINPDAIVASDDALQTRVFNVSLKVFTDMLAQLKTERVALDINIAEGNITCIRLSEVDTDAFNKKYTQIREEVAREVQQAGGQFDPYSTPTPLEKKLLLRNGTLKTKQYTMLSQ